MDMKDIIEENEYDSALGEDPVCDLCTKSIVKNDIVIQIFKGVVVSIEGDDELGVSGSFNLYHLSCYKNKLDELPPTNFKTVQEFTRNWTNTDKDKK
jgi:hypothetical protein